MDFESETVSSDSSFSDSNPAEVPKKVLLKRKIRMTEEFAPLDVSIPHQKSSKQASEHKRKKISFLPKIDDLEEDGHHPGPAWSTSKPKQRGPSFAIKIASLKKLKIKKKRIKVANPKQSGTKRKLLDEVPMTSSVARRLKLEPSNLAQVLSDAVEEFRSDARMSLKLKREKDGWKSVSSEESSPRIIFRDLYVNLTPLEKTNLLSKQQLQELEYRKLCNNHRGAIELHGGKENIKNKVKTAHRKSDSSSCSSFSEYYRPCKVLLPRLNLVQTKPCYLLNHSEMSDELAPDGDNTLVIRRISSNLGNSFSTSLKRRSSGKNKSLLVSMAAANSEESFCPGGSSSPLVLFPEAEVDEGKIAARRLTYDIDNASTRRSFGNQSFEISGCENLNGTYEVDDLRKTGDQDKLTPSKSSRASTTETGDTVGKRRRSTVTLEDNINDIALLKSTSDSNGAPRKLIVAVTKSPRSDFSNVTLRKHSNSCAKDTRPALERQKWFDEGSLSPSSDVENTSPPEGLNGTFALDDTKSNKTDDYKLFNSEASGHLTKDLLVISEEEPTSSPSISSEEEPTSSPSVSSIAERSTFTNSNSSSNETDCVVLDNSSKENMVQTVSALKTTTPKSVLKSKNSRSNNTPRRVTFSNLSIIILDDSNDAQGSIVPTQFPSDDDSDNPDQELRCGNLASAGRTPARGRRKVADSHLNSKRSASFHTTLDSSNNRSTLLGSPVPRKTPKRTKMPDFAKIHQKMYDKMLNIKEYSQNKQKRAQLLLSKHKLANGSSSKQSDRKSGEPKATQIPKMVKSKKQLQYSADSSAAQPIIKLKKLQLVSSTPKRKKGENGCGEYGFKARNYVSKDDQKRAVANKTRPLKLHKEDARTEIKGVRSNRRFELLMEMRQKKQT